MFITSVGGKKKRKKKTTNKFLNGVCSVRLVCRNAWLLNGGRLFSCTVMIIGMQLLVIII